MDAERRLIMARAPHAQSGSRALRKPALPSKICLRCGRPFSWRKKWERCWAEVKFCSERCRRQCHGS